MSGVKTNRAKIILVMKRFAYLSPALYMHSRAKLIIDIKHNILLILLFLKLSGLNIKIDKITALCIKTLLLSFVSNFRFLA